MRHAIITQCGIYSYNGQCLLEATMRRNHPFGARLRKDNNILSCALSTFTQTAPEGRGHTIGLNEILPLILAHIVLLEYASIRLHLILFAEDLTCAQATFVRMHLGHIVEHLLQRVDVVLQHLYVHLTWRFNGSISQRMFIGADDTRLKDSNERKLVLFEIQKYKQFLQIDIGLKDSEVASGLVMTANYWNPV